MSTQTNSGPSLAARLNAPLSQFAEALRTFARALRVAMPGTIVSFDASKQTATIQPAITEVDFLPGTNGQMGPRPLPRLVDVPVMFPRAGAFALTMPVQAGDECLVIFGDQCMDAWFQSGAAGAPVNEFETRRHSLADGFALVGLWNQTRHLSAWSTSSAQLRSVDGTVTVDVSSSAITLTAPTVTVSGSTTVHITGAGQTTIEGKNFLEHTHSGVASGGSASGPVV
jgi:phage baseplate assembly protein gpV